MWGQFWLRLVWIMIDNHGHITWITAISVSRALTNEKCFRAGPSWVCLEQGAHPCGPCQSHHAEWLGLATQPVEAWWNWKVVNILANLLYYIVLCLHYSRMYWHTLCCTNATPTSGICICNSVLILYGKWCDSVLCGSGITYEYVQVVITIDSWIMSGHGWIHSHSVPLGQFFVATKLPHGNQ